ncbi:adenylate kinase [Nodosilinea sp. FACHB-131]|uniref:AAA family ATPase n=1 Tax=Cyanophyceae TaxID=3028117 RepID=UPI0016874012|nr:adenylate kinase [Nodosilinea sp. FACHB-131]MBD1874839.1 adenylate kinase [Nodosilinea sp. FACHB-131]
MRRIAIVGTTGSGKTTLARQVAQRCLLSHVELDALQWEPNWTPTEPQVFRDRVRLALSGDRWVVDGNYSAVRDIVWSRADTVVFLDYPFGLVLRRLLRRTWRRSLHQEELWNGNRETFRQSFFSRDSILVWLLRTYWKKRKQYPALFRQPEYAHLATVQLRSPKAAEKWLLSCEQHSV